MLQALELTNFAIVDTLRINLSAGLNVLTGETGAGKSILIDALALLSGNRAEVSWIRRGSESALIQAVFCQTSIDSAARRIAAAGRSTARVNGELVTVTELSEELAELLIIHGQNASQILTSGVQQRQLLDRQLSPQAKSILEQYGQTFASYQQILAQLETLSTAMRERARRIDILQFQLDEIYAANLQADELESLREELNSLRYAERILQAAGGASMKLSENDISAVSLIAEASRDLEAASRFSKALESLSHDLSEALASIEAVAQEIGSFVSGFEVEPGRLEALETRMAVIENLQRKYGDSIEAILSYGQIAQSELDELIQADDRLAELEQQKTELQNRLRALAGELSQARQTTAKQLSKAVTAKLRPLGMNSAVFAMEVQATDKLQASGQDSVTFMFSANLGEVPAPLSAVASGGELSRVMLALNVVTGSDIPILVFDEVDAGIGGKTARAVGQLLKQLAQQHQILLVTHLPQVAAFADTHFHVEKLESSGRTITRVTTLSAEEREQELARMLAGTVTEASLATARELLRDTQHHR